MSGKMKIVARDIGVFASTDPVAVDVAVMDILDNNEDRKVFRGRDIFKYSEVIGLGSTNYELIKII